jgi:anti-anti-sigma factor
MSNNDLVPGFDDEKDETLKIKLQDIPDVEGCLVLTLHGYIDTYNSTRFQKRVQLAIDEGFIRLIFNCSGLNHVSSTGIGSFTVFLKAVKSQGGDIILLEIQPEVYEVLQLLGFSQFFNIQTDLNESVDFFRSNEPQQEAEIFPKIFACPFCSKNLKAVKPGRFRCSDCKTILAIDNTGAISLG